MSKQASVWKGMVAGVVGGLAAAWVMNVFMAGPGQALQAAAEGVDKKNNESDVSAEPKEDATMKTAQALTHTFTGGELPQEQKEAAGPAVHYVFGGLMGAAYGGLAETIPAVTAGFGTSFGSVLFSTADMLAIPALKLGPSPTEQPASAQASPFSAHVVYGVTTELVRRLVRMLL